MIIRLDDNTWYKKGCYISYWYCFERLENNNAVIRSRKLRKDKQYNCQTKNDQRKRNICLSTQLIIQQDDPHCKPGWTRVYGKGKQFIILMLYSCITAPSHSDTSYIAVYAAVGSFVVTALMCVIIFLAILRYDVIVFIICFQYFSEQQISAKMIRGTFQQWRRRWLFIFHRDRSCLPFRCRIGNPYSQSCIKRSHLGQRRSDL